MVARSHSKGGLAAIVVAAAALVIAAPASAYIYWTDLDGQGNPARIGRANNNGTHVQPNFIADAKSTPDAITTDRRHVYWVSSLDSIGRARIDGTKVESKFIDNVDGYVGDLVALGGYIYWTNDDLDPAIGRARANGTEVDSQFIPVDDEGHALRYSCPKEIAIAGDYLYWTNCYRRYSIGRARLDGTDLDREFVFVERGDPYSERLRNPFGIAATESYVYWTDRGSKSIGRAATDGSGVDLPFVSNVGPISTLAADDTYLYWGAIGGQITRSRLDGTQIKTVVKKGVRSQALFVDRLGP